MTYGTTLGPVRARLVELLSERQGLAEVAVGYDPPNQAKDVFGPTGLRQAIWLDALVEGASQELQALGTPLHWQEIWLQKVVCQVLPRSNADDQQAVDDAVSLLVGEVLTLVSQDPTLDGLSIAGWTVRVIPDGGFKYEGGQTLSGTGQTVGAAARIELDLRVEASNC